ncbi:NAD(P)-dependent oxidoreductase [Glycomyces arizonensis]|uniref:NAD(P)-dependent oxidoreductase n=1 Tax=Glycomyces arizonensis TaxID=256035 RepID=UPI0003FCA86C|nr:NAD(P)H-binding protein [Glycomyces arizonensis]
MRIAVFGAGGSVGSRTVAEAAARGHKVLAIARKRLAGLPGNAETRIGDVTDTAAVERLSGEADVVISAVRPPQGLEHQQAAATKTLLDGVAPTGTRLLIVGGAATLRVPDTGGLVMDDPRYVQAPWRAIAAAGAEQHEVCRGEKRVDWVYVSPSANLVPGERTGRYRIGGDELLTDEQGDSRISVEDLAVALIDEAESPRHHRTRFTVAAA